jgi:hypothetical protein
MSTRHIRNILDGLYAQIAAHQTKIRQELDQEFPNQVAIQHWEHEIRTWQSRIARLEHRLRQRRQRGRGA